MPVSGDTSFATIQSHPFVYVSLLTLEHDATAQFAVADRDVLNVATEQDRPATVVGAEVFETVNNEVGDASSDDAV